MSGFYLPNNYMLGLLSKLQQIQLDLVKSGHSADIDASTRKNLEGDGTHISIEVYIDGRLYDFSGLYTREELDARLESINKQYD